MLNKKPTGRTPQPVPIAKPISAKEGKPTKKAETPKRKGSGGEPADEVIDLLHGIEPPTQGIIHRFSLHLQANIARRAMGWLGIAVCVNTIALIILSIYASSSIKIIAVDSAGRLYDVVAKRESSLEYTDSQIASFGVEVAFDAFDINFANYERRLQRLTDSRFTNNGKNQFMVAMQDVLRTLQQTQGFLIVQMPEGKFGEVVAKNSDGTQWTVQIPLLMTLKPAKGEPVTNSRLVTMIIDRIDDYTNLKGIAVNQVVVQGGS